jgi:hypothetical protein
MLQQKLNGPYNSTNRSLVCLLILAMLRLLQFLSKFDSPPRCQFCVCSYFHILQLLILVLVDMGPQYTGSLGNVQMISPDRTMILSVNGIASEQRFGAKIAAQTAEPYYQIQQVLLSFYRVLLFLIAFIGGS